jgi:two-component system chemotaxis response regulator CheY
MSKELLAIDDADLHLSILRKIAVQAGFNTTGAESVSAAKGLLRTRKFDCITLDLSLGEQSGIEVLALLYELRCPTPVIIISASNDAALNETVRIGKFLNVNLYASIPKPVNLAVLRQTLAQVFSGAPSEELEIPVSG